MFDWAKKLWKKIKKPKFLEMEDETKEMIEEATIPDPSHVVGDFGWIFGGMCITFLGLWVIFPDPDLVMVWALIAAFAPFVVVKIRALVAVAGKQYVRIDAYNVDGVKELRIEKGRLINLNFEPGMAEYLLKKAVSKEPFVASQDAVFMEGFAQAIQNDPELMARYGFSPEHIEAFKQAKGRDLRKKKVKDVEEKKEELVEVMVNGGREQVRELEARLTVSPEQATRQKEDFKTAQKEIVRLHYTRDVKGMIQDVLKLEKEKLKEPTVDKITEEITEYTLPLVNGVWPEWRHVVTVSENGTLALFILPDTFENSFDFATKEIDVAGWFANALEGKCSGLFLAVVPYLFYTEDHFLRRVMPVFMVTDSAWYHQHYMKDMRILDLKPFFKEGELAINNVAVQAIVNIVNFIAYYKDKSEGLQKFLSDKTLDVFNQSKLLALGIFDDLMRAGQAQKRALEGKTKSTLTSKNFWIGIMIFAFLASMLYLAVVGSMI